MLIIIANYIHDAISINLPYFKSANVLLRHVLIDSYRTKFGICVHLKKLRYSVDYDKYCTKISAAILMKHQRFQLPINIVYIRQKKGSKALLAVTVF